MLFYDPEEAAYHANEIIGNISDWWQSKDLQNARSDFLIRHFHTKKSWATYWHSKVKVDNRA